MHLTKEETLQKKAINGIANRAAGITSCSIEIRGNVMKMIDENTLREYFEFQRFLGISYDRQEMPLT